jgi:hypothetical protein
MAVDRRRLERPCRRRMTAEQRAANRNRVPPAREGVEILAIGLTPQYGDVL